jgi:probable F420-dependent oxidoreductase
MKLGVTFASTGYAVSGAGARLLGQEAERLGYDSLWTVEHVVVPAGYSSKYPYNSSGKMTGGDDVPIPDPITWLTWVGAHTEKILLATGVLILPEHNPVVLAKELATLDSFCPARVRLGAGIGWLREEFEVIGVPFEERVARAEESIALLRALWSMDEPSFHGRFWNFDDARLWPKPANRGIPVIIGGHGDNAARRAARLGDGFFPANADLDEIESVVRLCREEAERLGRDPASIEITAGTRPEPANIERFLTIGVDRMVVPAFSMDADQMREALARKMAAFTAAVGSLAG